jgi:putative CocE/NonD family hydrolase
MGQEKNDVRDGMRITWDAAIQMDDGVVLRADVFRPVREGKYPVIMSYGPYGKGLAFQDGYKTAWQSMERDYPDAVAGTSNAYANWEVVDPEKWVPHGYVVVRVDSRGAGRSPGYLCHNNHREQKDYHDCIEWAAVQPWSTGKVGLNGISYYGANQWFGRGGMITIATAIGTAAFCARFARTGRTCRSKQSSTALATAVRLAN